MSFRISGLLAIAAFVAASLLGSAQSFAQNAYITNSGDNTVSVIDTTTDTVTATIPVGNSPYGVAVTPDGNRVYITNEGDNTVSVIDTTTNTVTATIPVGGLPEGVAVSPDGSRVYTSGGVISTLREYSVSVINTATNTVIATIPIPYGVGVYPPNSLSVAPDGSKVYITTLSGGAVINTATNTVIATFMAGENPADVVVTPDGSKLYALSDRCEVGCGIYVINTATNTTITTIYDLFGPEVFYGPRTVSVSPNSSKVYVAANCLFITNCGPNIVAVIDTATNTVIATIPVGISSFPVGGVSVTPDGSKVYAANFADNSVSVIDTATNTVTASISVGSNPVAFGVFIPIPVPQSAPAAGNLCNGIYDGTFNGNLTVSAGQDCIFLKGRITGNVNVVGGNFALNGSAVGGNLTVNGGGTYTLGPAATVGGNLMIQKIPPGSANNSVCGTTVYGSMQVDNNGTAIQMGSTAPLFCAGDTIGGNLEVVDNSNSALMFDNSVGGNMSVLDNTGPVDVVSNTARGNLLCQNNPDLIMGGGNTASRKTGQCN
jgi:YVTN family beta-propeller protein